MAAEVVFAVSFESFTTDSSDVRAVAFVDRFEAEGAGRDDGSDSSEVLE